MLPVIRDRRSVRKYKDIAVPKHLVEEIVEAGILAPSSKNRQPWKFIVTTGAAKEESLHRMEAGLQREKEKPSSARERSAYWRGRIYACYHAAGSGGDLYCQYAGKGYSLPTGGRKIKSVYI